jgi:hypothetical protein
MDVTLGPVLNSARPASECDGNSGTGPLSDAPVGCISCVDLVLVRCRPFFSQALNGRRMSPGLAQTFRLVCRSWGRLTSTI